jgi:arabinofuranan 3-O-arabinosyltransferase
VPHTAPTAVLAGPGAPALPGAYTAELSALAVVQGGPEVIERLNRNGAIGPVLLAADARRAGLPTPVVTVTDTPMDRETDFGQVDSHSSAVRAPDDPRRTRNLVPDYPVPSTPLVEGNWTGARISVSSSAADATQLGGATTGGSAAAATAGDATAGWVSGGIDSAIGQWLQLDLDHPITAGLLRVTVSPSAIGPDVRWIDVSTPVGSVAARVDTPGAPVTVSLPTGRTPWVRITATHTRDDTPGSQFGISGLTLFDYSTGVGRVVPIRHRVILPTPPAGAFVQVWDLGQEFPARAGCFDAPDRVRCDPSLPRGAEEPGAFERTLTVPGRTTVRPELTVRARPGQGWAALLADPTRPVAHGQGDSADARGWAYAATDGDPRTSWTAARDVLTHPAGAKPTLTIDLPAATLVTGVVVTAGRGQLPAHPTSVSVNLGDGPQVRPVTPDGLISLHPHLTRRILLSLETWRPVLDRTALGFVQSEPPGLAGVAVLGPDHRPIGGPPAAADRLVTVDCAHGPALWLAGRVLRAAVTATAAQLVSSAPVPATLCDGPDPTTLPAGRVDVSVLPGGLFTVDRVRLVATGPPQPVADRGVRLLVLPLSANRGWRARTADGLPLRPIVVDGWQQGWLLPASARTPVTVSFPADHWYRAALLWGLPLVLPVLLLAGRRPAGAALGPPRGYHGGGAAYAGVLCVLYVVAGGWGVAAFAAALALTVAGRGRPFLAPAAAGSAAMASMAVLSTGPWRSPTGYLGGSAAAAAPALLALALVGCAAAGRPAWIARRAGTSTKP